MKTSWQGNTRPRETAQQVCGGGAVVDLPAPLATGSLLIKFIKNR